MTLGLKGASYLLQKKKQKCERCSLYYLKTEDTCSHCGNLSEVELQNFLEKVEQEKAAAANLGNLFIYISILILLCMLVLL